MVNDKMVNVMRKQYFIPLTEQTELGIYAYICQVTSTKDEKAPGVQLAPKKKVF